MYPPLARLTRNDRAVFLHDPMKPPLQIRFHTVDDAEQYLRHWREKSGEMDRLREVLRQWSGSFARPMSDDEVIRALAAKLYRGELALSTWRPDKELPTFLRPVETAKAPAGSALAAGANLAPPPSPLLPRLEMVQIEGADVLVEVQEALDQIDVSIGEIDTAGVSLEPAPSGVSAIEGALGDVNESISSALSDL